MKTTLRWALMLGTLATLSVMAGAREYKVKVAGEQEAAQEIVNAVKARVGASSRFTDSDVAAEVLLVISCQATARNTGYVCSLNVILWMPQTHPFPLRLGDYLSSGPDAVSVAERLFQAFVTEIADDKVEAQIAKFYVLVEEYCDRAQNKKHCKSAP
jgi:hypothetical protein